MKTPAELAKEESRRLHREAFPESYQTDEPNPETTGEQTDPQETVVPETPPEVNEWQGKYETLHAKYQSEVPRLHSWIKDKDAKIVQLESRIRELETANQAPPFKLEDRDEEGNALYKSPHITDEMRKSDNYQYLFNEYGQTHAERHFESSILAARSTMKPVEEKVDHVSALSAEDRFNETLSGVCPTWKGLTAGVNMEPQFEAWLQNPAPGTGMTYQQLAVEAYGELNVQRLADIITMYEQSKPKTTETPKPKIPEELIAPNKTGGGSQTPLDNNKGDVLTFAAMNQLYADYRDGKYKGKETEYQQKKNQFMKAKAEGRLI